MAYPADITPREATPSASSRLLSFQRIRSGASVRFYPGAGTRLHFANADVDTLEMPGVPSAFLAAGDVVTVSYKGATVFRGDVATIAESKRRGTDATQTVTCVGPWSKMARLVYRQNWYTGSGYARSSRLVLNQHQDGTAQNLNSELYEIASHGATPCGYTVASADISVSTQQLPFDECRDITVADAIRRELRFFPKAICRFDYSGATPALKIKKTASPSTASYVAAIPKTQREYVYNAHPITGVDLEIETTGTINGAEYRQISHQTAGNTLAGNPDCLYATLQIRGASSNVVRQSFKSVTETPTNWTGVDWWKAKHPRLANVATSAITISEAKCDGQESLPTAFPRISAATAGELEEAGLTCKVCTFTCKATIATTDDKEEDIYLTMNFLMTNAAGDAEHPRNYTWVAESSAESGETVPTGLAAAILADRAGALVSERMTIRLGDSFPQLGDAIVEEAGTVFLQSFDVDCSALTADLVFGVPDHLAPEDMAALLSGFRNKRTCASATTRKTGKPSDGGADVELGGIPPLSSTEFAPGQKSKTIFGSTAANSPSFKFDATGPGGNVDVKSSAIPSGKTIAVKTLTVKGAGENGADKTFNVLADSDVTIPKGGSEVDPDGKSIEKVPDAEAGATPTGDEGKIQIKGFDHAYDGKVPYKKNNELVWGGKAISDVQATPIGGTPGGVKITITYSDGSSTEINLSNGMRGKDGDPGQDGETPEITAERNGDFVEIFADDELIATLSDGKTPTITANKNNGVTTILADGVPIATIADGAAVDISALNGVTLVTNVEWIGAPDYVIRVSKRTASVANNVLTLGQTVTSNINTTPLSQESS